jgi:hypothetical protein
MLLVQVLQISELLEIYIIINFMMREINWNAHTNLNTDINIYIYIYGENWMLLYEKDLNGSNVKTDIPSRKWSFH